MSIMALLTIAKSCSSLGVHQQSNKENIAYTRPNYSSIKKTEIMSLGGKWRGMDIMLSEINMREKYQMFSYMESRGKTKTREETIREDKGSKRGYLICTYQIVMTNPSIL
jgi:hypothetical protein